MSIDYIYDIRADKNANGMSIKEALHHMKKVGYISNNDYRNNDYDDIDDDEYNKYVSNPEIEKLVLNFDLSDIPPFIDT